MSLSRRPTRKSAEAIRLALTTTGETWEDRQIAMQIWNDFRWKLKTIPERTYEAIDALIDAKIKESSEKIRTEDVRNAVVLRLNEMRARLSEFTVAPEPDEPPAE